MAATDIEYKPLNNEYMFKWKHITMKEGSLLTAVTKAKSVQVIGLLLVLQQVLNEDGYV